MADTTVKVLDQSGLETVTRAILSEVNQRIANKMVTTINGDSDDKHVATAKAVYGAIGSLNNIKYITVASGNIEDVNMVPDNKTLYVVRKTAASTTATSYVYINEDVGFIALGTTPETGGDSISYVPLNELEILTSVGNAADATTPT